MSEIRMDLDQAEQTITMLSTAINDFSQTLSTMRQAAQSLEMVWEGAAQRAFRDTWEAWLSTFQARIEELEPLRSGVITERQQLIDADRQANFT